jgi:UDPglucose--hexose-1-phosphate uridylyltransferase
MEIRNHYFLQEQVIISEKRVKRPHELVDKGTPLPKEKYNPDCPFCRGNEKMTPPTTYQHPKGKNWEYRTFANKYPLLDHNISYLKEKNKLFTKSSAYGVHEVITETPWHNKQWQHLSKDELAGVFDTYKKRYNKLIKTPNIKYVMLFKNYGLAGGASLVHSHSQLLATPFVPSRIMLDVSEMSDYSKRHFRCVMCDVVEKESKSERMILENKDFVVISPYCARYPFELWFLSKKHISDFSDINIKSYADILHETLKRMFSVLGDFPFNMFIHHLPKKLEAEFHFHSELQPRLKKEASVELGYGTKVNVIPPEKVAEHLKK